jgi:hypothetical protein
MPRLPVGLDLRWILVVIAAAALAAAPGFALGMWLGG